MQPDDAPGLAQGNGSAAIEISGLRRSFGRFVAVDGVSLSIDTGEMLSLLGPNGAGKTTTIRMLCCLLRPTEGTATIRGHDIRTDPLAVKRVISVSPQETAIADHLNAWENMSLMARLHGIGKAETSRRSEELLELMGLAGRAGDRAKKYSGGMKRRLSIAMALVSGPEVLFLDEPTLGLDPQSRRGLWEHISGLKGATTIVLTTHYLEEADALADRIAVIDHGKIVALGTAAELKAAVPGGNVTVVEADVTAEAIDALRRAYPNLRRTEGGVEIDAADVSLEAVVDVLRPLGITVRSSHRRQVTLDDVFVHLTGRQLRE
jgi:ABC-2 type transport system ATP-binding protein